MSDISTPVIRTPVIRTLYWKTVAIYPYINYAGYKNIYAVPDDVLITGIHCINIERSF